MYPKELQELLDIKIKEYSTFKIVLVFGDCHARMVDYEKNKNIVRTPGINCCEIFLGTAMYKKIRREGAFILLPEWSVRWEEIFKDYLGFKTSQQIQPFMNELHKKLVYVNTGYNEKNNQLLNEISDFMGLPLEIHNSSIDELEKTVLKLLSEEPDTNKKDTNGR